MSISAPVKGTFDPNDLEFLKVGFIHPLMYNQLQEKTSIRLTQANNSLLSAIQLPGLKLKKITLPWCLSNLQNSAIRGELIRYILSYDVLGLN